MRNFAALLAVCCIVACEELPVDVVSSTPTVDLLATWQANLSGNELLPGASASVEGADYGSYLEFDVSLSGAQPSTTYAWRVLAGTCAQPGDQHSSDQAYTNLVANTSGSAQVHSTVVGHLDRAGSYVVTILRPDNAVVACGTLQP